MSSYLRYLCPKCQQPVQEDADHPAVGFCNTDGCQVGAIQTRYCALVDVTVDGLVLEVVSPASHLYTG